MLNRTRIFDRLVPYAAIFAAMVLAGGAAQASTTVNLTAQRSVTTLPDGNSVPMWCYAGGVDTTVTNAGTTTGSACTSAAWAPGPTIAVPAGDTLTINLTNALPTPTSIVILGQVGGGLGAPNFEASPTHNGTPATTWPVAAASTFTPPAQGPRARSFSAEVPAASTTATSALAYTWTGLKPGTYLYETGSHPSLQAPMGLYGVLVVTQAPTTGAAGCAYPVTSGATTTCSAGTSYDADVALLLSEIDPVQNAAVDAAAVAGTDEHTLWSDPSCIGSPAPSTSTTLVPCYPPAVNYAPLYFLINGKSFDLSAIANSQFAGPAATGYVGGNVLLRFVNAGLRSHTPTVVGLPMSLIAEDGNFVPGNPKIQAEVLLTAGKTFDAVVTPGAAGGAYTPASYSIFDRQLALSTNNASFGGMQGYLQVAGGAATGTGTVQALSKANPDNFVAPLNATTLSGNVLANDVGVTNPVVQGAISGLTLLANGNFTYAPGGSIGATSFTYCGNGATSGPTCALVTIGVAAQGGAPVVANQSYTSNVASVFTSPRPGVLAGASDPSSFALTAQASGTLPAGVSLNADGSFSVTSASCASIPCTVSFSFVATNAQGTSSAPATATVNFVAGSGLAITVKDALNPTIAVTDYRWMIEEDTTFHTAPGVTTGTTPVLGTSFHSSYMPLVAAGCTGALSCGTGQTAGGVAVPAKPISTIDQVVLDPTKYYYVTIFPGDAANPVVAGFSGDPSLLVNQNCLQPSALGANDAPCGHTIGGAPITPGQLAATVLVEPNPLKPAQLSIFIFEDNNPTNGDVDQGEVGLGGFNIVINDVAGRSGDPVGQITYDAFNMPLTNALLGTPGCPNEQNPTTSNDGGATAAGSNNLVGVIYTCPSPPPGYTGDPAKYTLAGHALVKNLMPGRYDVIAHPGAAREGAGETWYQVSTLEGTPAQDAFARSGEPSYFQEFGPPGFHTFIGFLNPAHIAQVNATLKGTNTITGQVTNLHMSRPSAVTNFDSGSRSPLAQTACYVGLNSTGGTGADIAFAQCDANGNFTLKNVPAGSHQIVVWDQWLDQILAYFAVTVPQSTTPQTVAMGSLSVFSWFTRVETSLFLNQDGTGLPDKNPGVAQVPITIRFRDGSISNILTTDTDGKATFDELFPLFNWYVMESDTTRFKSSNVHVIVDGGGPVDCTTNPGANCPANAALAAKTTGVLNSMYPGGTTSTERFDPAGTLYEGLQGFISQTQIVDWAKTPYGPNENGGITGLVVYASTRGFDEPKLEVQFLWEPLVPRVKVNLYQEITQPDGSTGLKLVNSTTTTSWDDWTAGKTALGTPSCPGQVSTDPYVAQTIGANNLTKCYDGFHNWNQVQPAFYDGAYNFTTMYAGGFDASGNPVGAATALTTGKYVVEIVPPAGYEIVKEEDKNILIGDTWIAPPAQQFAALGNIFIMPDQAVVYGNQDTGGGNSFPPCVGSPHRVPDYLSLFPQARQIAPYAGFDKPLCDRKEVTVANQMQSSANFYVFTSTPIASHFTGMILDDASAEFNPAAPDYGEKFAVPFAPVSIKNAHGQEISRVYSDQWGMFNGLTPSTWQVNVPNPAGYSPNMLITCMNDPGPILDTRTGSPTFGQMITDPQYMPTYSNFCYTNPFMPGLTDYLDTPVLPVAAFASNYVSGYNPPDCAYPDATPAIKRVDGDSIGPYLSTGGAHTLTITALGTVTVPNPAYLGPSAPAGISSQKTTTRNYTFGAAKGTITLTDYSGNVTTIPPANVTWTDGSISVAVPITVLNGSYELGIIAANGKKSVDTVTVTIEPKAPTFVSPVANGNNAGGAAHPIQDAIDAAAPGDLIIVDAGIYNELVVMWKPVRLQGVGAASVIINAAKYPTDKLERWRPTINGLFGVDPITGNAVANPQVDPLPGQEITGGIVQLEPSVLSTEEGAGITVLAKEPDLAPCSNAAPSSYVSPDGKSHAMSESNFNCVGFAQHPRVDGFSVTGGDAGGGIYVNGWAHGLEIANNRVYGNAGAYNGGVRVGIPYLEGQTAVPNGGFSYDNNVHIHHNAITNNGTVEAPAAAGGTAAGGGAGGGLSICTGTDNYRVNYNFICGNYTSGDGGGVGHIGVSLNGQITNNQIVFNQSFLQATTVNGGGLVIEGEAPAAGGVSLGTGNVLVDANLIMGNFAEAGHGGGVRLQQVNGADVAGRNPGNGYRVTLSNNMIVNNVAGWSGGGISLADTLNSVIVNNTVASNDSVGIAGPLFVDPSFSTPQPAGISAELTSAALLNTLPNGQRNANRISNPTLTNNIVWQNRSFFVALGGPKAVNPVGYTNGTTTYYTQAVTCSSNSAADAHNASSPCVQPPASTQTLPANGACSGWTPAYWDLGVVGDASSAPGALHLNPRYSVLTSTTGYGGGGTNNTSGNPQLVSQYCNGSLATAASLDESGNFVDFRYGPLSIVDPSNAAHVFGDYHIVGTASSAYNSGTANGAPNHDFDGQPRPQAGAYDIGADEYMAPAPIASLSATTLAFSSVLNTASASQPVTVTNTGSAALIFNGITIGAPGNNGNQFAQTSDCPIGGAGLAVGASCTINVTFTPTTAGNKNASLRIADNVAGSPQLVSLTGTVLQGAISFTNVTFGSLQNVFGVRTLVFGNQTGPQSSTVTLTNTGAAPVAISSAVVNGGSFSKGADTCSGTTVAVNGTCTITVNFNAPAGNSARFGSLSVTDNGANSPQFLALTGS